MKKDITVTKVLSTLFLNPIPPIVNDIDTSSEDIGKGTTIRLSPRAKQFYTYHAKRLTISHQAVITLILEAVMTASTEPFKSGIGMVVERFKILFEEHEIPPIYIKSIIDAFTGRNFPVGALSNNEILASVLDSSYFDSLSQLFGVGVPWLDGRNIEPVQLTPIIHRDWSFEPVHHAQQLTLNDDFFVTHELSLIVSESADPTLLADKAFGERITTIIPILTTNYTISGSRQFSFVTYRVEGLVPWLNTEARIGLKAVIKYAEINDIHVLGKTYSHDVFAGLMVGLLPATLLSTEIPTTWNAISTILMDANTDKADAEYVQELVERLQKL